MEEKELDESIMTEGSETLDIQPEETGNKAKNGGIAGEVFSWFDSVIHTLIIAILVFTFLSRAATVDGDSMLPTLEDRQLLMTESLFYEPDYNDIVVVWAEGIPGENGNYGKPIVKRVIGLAGDQISIDYLQGYVYRNGEQLPLTVKDNTLYEDGHTINTYTNYEEGLGGEFTVPEGCVFVMGDNRNNSTDSRSKMVGYVDKRNIMGKVYLRIWPIDKFGGLY